MKSKKVSQKIKTTVSAAVAVTMALPGIANARELPSATYSDASAESVQIQACSNTVDKSILKDLITQAEGLDTSPFSDAGVAFFNAVIASAEAVASDVEATQETIDQQVKLLETSSAALVAKSEDGKIYDGVYSISGRMWHATQDQPSMGNNALAQPMELTVKDGKTSLRIKFQSLTVIGNLTGNLAKLSYFPNVDKETVPNASDAVPVTVESQYDFYDSFNDPNKGTDKNIKGVLYPEYVSMPVDLNDEEIWVQVYVPVMESVSAGSGTQLARLQLDWDTLSQTSGTKTDKTALTDLINQAEQQTQGAASDTVYQVLTQAIASAKSVNMNMNVDQKAVDATVIALQSAIDAMPKAVVVDKSILSAQITSARAIGRDAYSETSYQALQAAIVSAENMYDNPDATEAEVEKQIELIRAAISGLAVKEADKAKLAEKIAEAEAIEGSQYTDDTYNALKETIKSAKGIYDSAAATQEQVNEQVTALESALTNLVEKPLDINHLADGIYAVTGDMQKVDKVTPSMSNEAINHTLKLTVEDGKYTLSMDFKGLKISSQFGYLGALKYYKTGYSMDQYGNPIGELADVTVESYQTNEDGTLISDTFGTNYPDIISFEMISEAREDSYVPLQVFVPIMENISAGTGTQSVFLHLDWNSLKKATADDPGFTDTSTPGETEGSGNKTDTGIGNTLKSNSLGKSSSLSSGLSGSGSNLNKNTAAGKNAATGIPGQQGMATAATLCVTALAGAVGFIAKKRKELDSK